MSQNQHPFDDELIAVLLHEVLVEESESVLCGVIGGVRPKLESIGLSLLCLHKVLIPALPYAGDHVGFVISSSGYKIPRVHVKRVRGHLVDIPQS